MAHPARDMSAPPRDRAEASQRRLRVCVLLGRYLPDFTGHGVQFESTLPHLRDQGVDTEIVTRRPEPGVSWPARDAGVVHRILPARGERMARARGTLTLRRWLRSHHREFDLVHAAFADWEFYLNVPLLRRLGLPVLHEMILLGADDPVAIGSERFGSVKLGLLRGVDAWLGISDAFVASLDAAGIPGGRFHRIYTALELERFRPASDEDRARLREALGIPQDARVVISVGAVLPRKGMDRLLRGWQRMGPEPGRDLLLLAGPATEAEGLRPRFLPHVRELRALAEQPGLAGTVRFTGRADDIERWVAASDVFALLSRKEGFGTVTAEAMACGLPCIVSPLDGIGREITEDGRVGWVVDDPDDADAVARMLKTLLDQPDLRRRIGEAACRSARERFSMTTRAARLAEIYRRLVQARASVAP